MKLFASAVLSAAFTAALALGAAQAAEETVDRRAPADPRGEVRIVNVAGEVRVLGWANAEVQVQGRLGAGVQRLEFRRDGRLTDIEVVLPRTSSRSGSADLVVRVPLESSLSIRTVSADQIVEGVRGSQRLQAVSGSITTALGRGEFEAQTVSGDVDVSGGDGKAGSVRIVTVSGDVRLADAGPELDLETVSGDMRVGARALERVRIKTTNGDLQLNGPLGQRARLQAESINGDLRFDLLGAVNAEFELETFNGRIDNCFGPKPGRTRQFAPGQELRFTEGKGDASVRIKSLNGEIRLCRS